MKVYKVSATILRVLFGMQSSPASILFFAVLLFQILKIFFSECRENMDELQRKIPRQLDKVCIMIVSEVLLRVGIRYGSNGTNDHCV